MTNTLPKNWQPSPETLAAMHRVPNGQNENGNGSGSAPSVEATAGSTIAPAQTGAEQSSNILDRRERMEYAALTPEEIAKRMSARALQNNGLDHKEFRDLRKVEVIEYKPYPDMTDVKSKTSALDGYFDQFNKHEGAHADSARKINLNWDSQQPQKSEGWWKRNGNKVRIGALALVAATTVTVAALIGMNKDEGQAPANPVDTEQIAERAPDMHLTDTEKRDYFGNPEAPKPGVTVFDVYRVESGDAGRGDGNQEATMSALHHDTALAQAAGKVTTYETGGLDAYGDKAWAHVVEGQPVTEESTSPGKIAELLATTPGSKMKVG